MAIRWLYKAPLIIRVLSYDAQDRLVAATTPTDTVAYTYDANGIRQSQTRNGQTTQFLIDPNRDYAQVIAELDASNVHCKWLMSTVLIWSVRRKTRRRITFMSMDWAVRGC